MHSSLLPIVERFPGRRVLLVGDFMLDQYVFGDAERVSPEAPVPVLRVVDRQDRVGGAGSVALNVLALDGRVQCFGLIGTDTNGERLAALLNQAGADTHGLVRATDRRTTTKQRVVGLAEHRHRQQLLRIDDETIAPPAAGDAEKLLGGIDAALDQADVVCLEDYAKGVLTPPLAEQIVRLARARRKLVLVDPARLGDWSRYRGANLLTPNRAELELAAGRGLADQEIAPAAQAIAKAHGFDGIVVTLGRDGARVVSAEGEVHDFPTQPRAVYDNTGAGDAVLAALAVALAAGAALDDGVRLANICGGLEVEKFGCVPITREEVLREVRQQASRATGKLRSRDQLLAELDVRRQRGESIVFTNGCFDLLHAGHAQLLEQARALGSLLVVGVNSDESVRGQDKGDDRPVRDEQTRARLLAALECVDYVTIFDEVSVEPLVRAVDPDVLVKGGDYRPEEVVGHEFVRSRGKRVAVLPLLTGFSTTGELERIRGGGVTAR